MTNIPILDDIMEISPGWISKILNARSEFSDCQVIDLTRENLNQDAGFVSQLVRLRLRYDEKPPSAPSSIIVKLAPKDAATKEFGIALALFQREVGFYRHFAQDNPCNPPRPYHADISDNADAFNIVIEDLGAHDPEIMLEGATAEEAHMVLTALGGLHAKYWKRENLGSHDWIPDSAMMAPALVGMANQVIPGFLDRFGDGMSVELRSALDEARGAYGELIELAAKNPNQTLCHTDTHLGNIVFQAGKPRFLDWQAFMIQSFSYDLAYFLNGNLMPSIRRKNQEALLDTYFEALNQGGVSDVSRDEVTLAYNREAAGQLVTIPLIAGAFLTDDERGHTLAAAWLPRFYAAMEDSDAPKQLADLLADA